MKFHPPFSILRLSFMIFFLSWLLSSCHKKDSIEDEHHEHDETVGIVVTPHMAEQFGIENETVSFTPFHHVIKTSGSIEPSASDIFTVTAKKNGIVSLFPGISTGANVKKGERLASISSDGIQGGDVTQAAMANLEIAKAEYERLKPLYEEGLVTASALREAERAFREAEALAGKDVASGTVSITAPTDGYILNLGVNSGDFVEAGTSLATIVKSSSQILKADLPARQWEYLPDIISANFVPEGKTETLKLADLNGKKISDNSSSRISAGYIPIYFSFEATPFAASGGYADVYLICKEKTNVISVPRSALIEIQGNKYVYVKTGSSTYEKRIVKTGVGDGERVEIRDGLTEGDEIAVKGASIIRMAEISSIAPPTHTHNH